MPTVTSDQPASYPRRILLTVAGMSPQIVTETLYQLAVGNEIPFVPTEIHIISTANGLDKAMRELLPGRNNWLGQLVQEYNLPSELLDSIHTHEICDEQGQPLADIRTPADNEGVATFIANTVCKLTQDPDAAVHFSIAGGRKTMGFYGGYALTLYGRQQDRLSHVLVSKEFEGNPEFFYPTKTSRVIDTREGAPIDTSQAKVTLAEIPFVRLRQEFPQDDCQSQSFRDTVESVQRVLQQPTVRIQISQRQLTIADRWTFELPPAEFTLYAWAAQRCKEGNPRIGETAHGADEAEECREYFKQCYRAWDDLAALGPDDDRIPGNVKLLGRDQPGTKEKDKKHTVKKYLRNNASHIKAALEKELGKKLAERIGLRTHGKHGHKYYALDLPADAITFED